MAMASQRFLKKKQILHKKSLQATKHSSDMVWSKSHFVFKSLYSIQIAHFHLLKLSNHLNDNYLGEFAHWSAWSQKESSFLFELHKNTFDEENAKIDHFLDIDI